jgi:hypothetical protein
MLNLPDTGGFILWDLFYLVLNWVCRMMEMFEMSVKGFGRTGKENG